ncbi:MAG TPA: hypothetical protein VG755_10305 [Nannocystaceae bacterium]|nr:hypothetical protein [Nannocystaceae bacterium]
MAAPATLCFVAVLALLGCVPALFSGLAADDFVHAAVLGDPAIPDAAMFDASALEITRPWWTDPDWHASFFRPLTVATHQLDHLLWPDAPWAMHLVSLGCYAALVLATAAVLRELGGPRWAMGLALWMFALDDAHASTVAWIAARGTILAAVFGMLTLALHIRSRRRRGALPFVALSSFVLALASSEVAVCALGYLIAYTRFVEPGTRKRWWAIAPYLAVASAWLVTRALLGFGTGGTGLYVEPWSDPLGFAVLMGPRVALLVASVLGVPLMLDPLAFFPGAELAAGLLSVCALLVLARLLVPVLRDDAIARCFALGMVLSAIPLATTVPQDRHTLLLGLGAFGLVSRVALALADGRLRSRMLRAIAWIWIGLHAVLGPLLLPLRSWTPAVLRQFTELTARGLPEVVDEPTVLFAAPSDLHIMYTRALRRMQGRAHPDRFHTLYTGAFPVEVVRAGPRTLELRAAGWSAAPMNRLFRAAPMRSGATFATSDFDAEVVATDAAGRATVVRFSFPCVLENCAIRWSSWAGDHSVASQPPREGESLVVE